MENAPALKEEEFITTLEDYRAKVRLQGESYYTQDGQRHQQLSIRSEQIVLKKISDR